MTPQRGAVGQTTGGRTPQRPALALLRNVSTQRIIRALEHEGFRYVERQGSQRVYQHADGRQALIHYHHGRDTLPPHVIRNLIIGTRWTKTDLQHLGLIH